MSTPQPEARRVAVYPGAFDPVHLGHLDIARRAARLFDLLIVAVFDRPNKRLVFSGPERIELFRRGLPDVPNVRVMGYDGLTVSFARASGARYLVRGLRSAADFDYEVQLQAMNRHLQPRIETVFLLTSAEYAFLSSSLIKEVAAEGADLAGLVPDYVAAALREALRQTR